MSFGAWAIGSLPTLFFFFQTLEHAFIHWSIDQWYYGYKGKPVPLGLEKNNNYFAFRDMEEIGGLQQFAGNWVAFVDGMHVLTEPDEGVLDQKLMELYSGKGAFSDYILRPGEKKRVVHFPSPIVVDKPE